MRSPKRIIAAVLSACMIVSSTGINVQAYNENNVQSASVILENETERELSGEIDSEESETLREKTEYEESSDSKTEEPIAVEGISGSDQESENGEPEETTDTEAVETGLLNFIMQENSYIQIPGEQNVAVSLGEEGSTIERAILQYRNTQTGQEFITEAVGIVDNMVRFSMEYNSEEQTGIYELERITYQKDGKSYQIVLAELNMQVVYGVNQEVETDPDDILVDEALLGEVEANVVTMDEDGNTISENSVEDILANAQAAGRASSAGTLTRGAKKLVVVLDPGHDSTHAGACYHGYQEQDLVLKIALYCKEELKKYSGVTVYMTRETKECVNGGSSVDSGTCNAKRVEFAASKGADVYVSFHLNASTSSSANGVGVYYPNGSYRPDIGEEGKALAWEIYQKLSNLGLSTWAGGILIHNSETGDTYPDGSLADYLGVIRRSKLAGFPAVLIEHAFISSSSDVNNFLNSDEKLKKLGVADAQGIADFYGLTLGGNTPEISWIQSRNSSRLRINWDSITDAVSYQVYRSTSETGDYSRIATVKNANRYDDSKVVAGQTYYYKVRAVYSDGKKSAFSQVHAGKTLVKPQITEIVSRGGGKLKITWSAVEGASEYELLRSESETGSYEKIATIGAAKNSYTDSNIKTQKNYFYQVRARGGEYNGYSGYSSKAYGWAVKKTTISSVSSRTNTSLVIKWKKVSNAYAYRIQRSTAKNGTYKTIATIKSANTTSYVDKKLKKEKKYYYKILVLNRVNGKNGSSGYCAPVSGNTICNTSLVYVKSKDSTSMELKWNPDPNAYGYRIKRSTKNGNFKKVADVTGSSTTSYIDKTITAGKRYYYVVQTIVDKNGTKGYSSNSKSATAVNIKKVTVKSQVQDTGLQLTWNKIAGANGYQIMRSAAKAGPYTELAKISKASVTAYTDTSVKMGERYYYKIRAIRTGTYTGYGSYTKALEKWMIAAPKSLKVTSSKPEQMKLTWKKVSKASGYEVLRSTKKNSGYQVIATLSGAAKVTYTDKTVLPGTTYYYKIAATGKIGKETGKGDETAPVSGKTNVPVSGIESIKSAQDNTLILQLKKVFGAYGYEIQRSAQPDGGYKTVGTLEDGTTEFTDNTVTAGSTCYYRIRTIWMISGKKYYSSYSEVKSGSVPVQTL